MWGGKKSVAENIFYDAMRQIGDKTGEEPLKVFKRSASSISCEYFARFIYCVYSLTTDRKPRNSS